MTKSELIERLIEAQQDSELTAKDIELAVNLLLEQMSEALIKGERVEVRGFGSFSLNYHAPRTGRNPKTGEPVEIPARYVPHFKPGKELRERVNATVNTNSRHSFSAIK
ncbi:integration host factor subunit beta [Endozoicomonas sp. SM1973]|uniref:Integration host factor subunit beta n=1 Tax=Spartinivicinus marinus TaxID=2994442 RepID=A0A853IDZ8_9GAMM|nr:integration host factor subunit beta [Spartinivicinus marinus]MCX4028481.1 integration host factor subunit beta [Spartinivicinus marinus]NYZ67405.1 integration host factor subunit beta [Spartinivicinus marinus]